MFIEMKYFEPEL